MNPGGSSAKRFRPARVKTKEWSNRAAQREKFKVEGGGTVKTGIRSRSIAAGRSAARKDTPCPRRRKASAIPEMCPTEPPARRPLQRSDRRNRSEEGRRRGSTAGGFRWARAREARTVHIRGREEPACSPRKIHAGNCEVSRGLQPRRSTRPPRSRKVFRGA